MDGKGDTFNIDRELDLRGCETDEAVNRVKEAISGVKQGSYMLVYVNSYPLIKDIAQAVVEKQATLDNVLKKNENDWVVMVKNAVPVAQAG